MAVRVLEVGHSVSVSIDTLVVLCSGSGVIIYFLSWRRE